MTTVTTLAKLDAQIAVANELKTILDRAEGRLWRETGLAAPGWVLIQGMKCDVLWLQCQQSSQRFDMMNPSFVQWKKEHHIKA